MIKYFFILIIFANNLFAQNEKRYFYFGRDYGSEAMFNPLAVIINGGFDILQASTHTRELKSMAIATGAKNVWENISDPFPRIKKFGWNNFLSQEVLPLQFDVKKAQWFPNYSLHFLFGGMNFRTNYEWFIDKNYSHPWAWASLTYGTYHFLNEAVENDRYKGVNVDPIADLLIFNIGGAALFLNDDVADFFSSTVQISDWSSMAAINPTFMTLENHGQNFLLRYQPSFWDSISIFTYWGDHGLVGLSIPKNFEEKISFGGGVVTRQVRDKVDKKTGVRSLYVDFGWIAGVFYDRNNSLMASLVLSNRINEKLKLNIYPGVITFKDWSPGIFFNVGNRNQIIFGLNITSSPIGLAYRNHL